MSNRARLALALVLAGLVPALPPAAAGAAGAATATAPNKAEAYFGFDLDLLAKSMAYLTTYRTQYGEAEGKVHFDQWLAGLGKTRPAYDSAYNAWYQRWQADGTGKIQARFLSLNAKYSQDLNFADVPRRDQEQHEGVTLDAYARISVALSQPPQTRPADLDRVLRAHGVAGQAQWAKVNAAWTQAMKNDPTFGLAQQFGALYQKYAGPAFSQGQEDGLAKSLAEHNRQPPPPRSDTATPPPPAARLDAALAGLTAPAPRDRWAAARKVLLECTLWAGPGRHAAADPRAAACAPAALRTRVLPLVVDAVDHHGDDSTEYGGNLLGFLGDLGLKDATVRAAVERALRRDRDRLAELEARMAPIQDKAVPERIFLRSKIDGYQAAVRDLQEALRSW